MDDYYNQRQPLLQQYGHIPPPQYDVGPPPPQYNLGPPPPQYVVGPPPQPHIQYPGGYQVPPAAYPVGDCPLPDPHQFGAVPLPPEPPIINTNFNCSLFFCITWTILLALPAMLFATCALICSIQSKRLQHKQAYERAYKRGSCALCLNITSIFFAVVWGTVVVLTIYRIVLYVENSQDES